MPTSRRSRRIRRAAVAALTIGLAATTVTARDAAGADPEPASGSSYGYAGGPATLRPQGELGTQAVYPDGSFNAISPARFYDSRTDGARTKLAAGETRVVQIAGRNGVLGASQVKAVAMNVTVDAPTAASFVSVYPSGVGRPDVSSVNFQPGRTIPNLIVVDIGLDGNVVIYNGGGESHVILDVVGWFSTSSGPAGGGLFPFETPQRVLDTRADAPVGGFTPFTTFGLGRRGGVPYDAIATTAVVNATVQSTGTGFATFYPSGLVPPNVSNLNFPGVIPGSDPSGLFVSNTVFAPLSATGTYVGYTESRPNNPKVQMIIDELAYFDDGSIVDGSLLQTPDAGPFRSWDSRGGYGSCTSKCPLIGGQVFRLNFSGLLPDPSSGVFADALALNVTIDAPTQSTFLTVFPDDIPMPDVSTLNFLAGQTTAHATIVRIDPANPVVDFFMPAGTANLIVDFLGHFEYTL
jgi:hypothetical protein